MKSKKSRLILSALLSASMVMSFATPSVFAKDNPAESVPTNQSAPLHSHSHGYTHGHSHIHVDVDDNHLEDYNIMYGLEEPAGLRPLLDVRPSFGTGFRSFGSAVAGKQSIKYVAILVEFPDDDMQGIKLDTPDAITAANMLAKDGGTNDQGYFGEFPIITFNEYFKKYSYGKLDVQMEFFPRGEQGQVISYISKKPRKYYLAQSATNPEGFTSSSRHLRELELMNEITNAVIPNLEKVYTREQLDSNNDGYMDSINFFIEGKFALGALSSPTGAREVNRGDILWSHRASTTLQPRVHGLNVGNYTVNNVGDPSSPGGVFSYKRLASGQVVLNRASYSVLNHEFMHTLGLPDLYRAGPGNVGLPVDFFDIMAYNTPFQPNGFLTEQTRNVLHWGAPILNLAPNTRTKIYKPKYQDPNEVTSVKITTPFSESEYFVLDYYDKPNWPNYTAKKSGLIAYRVNTKSDTNLLTTPDTPEKDYLFVFRPGETSNGQANVLGLKDAVFSGVGTTFGKGLAEATQPWDKDTLYLSNGNNSGIKVEIVDETSDYIEIQYTAPEIQGKGTEADPYLISTYEQWVSLARGAKYSKLVNDIDFAGKSVSPAELENGGIDGGGFTLKNLAISGSGIFSSVENSKIKNLNIDGITVTANSIGENTGSLVGSFGSGLIDNVHVKNATVIGSDQGVVDTQGTGGLVGRISGGTISNSSAIASVSVGKQVGGFIGVATGGTVNDNWSASTVTKGTGKTGDFYGDNLFFPSFYPGAQSFFSDATYQNNLFLLKDGNTKKATAKGNKPGIYGVNPATDLELDLNGAKTHDIIIKGYGVDTINLTVDALVSTGDVATTENATITATTKGQGTYAFNAKLGNAKLPLTANLNVIGEDDKSLVSISIDDNTFTLPIGNTEDLVVTYNPTDTTDDKTISWSSDHDDIVSVTQEGKVTALSPGTAIITANVGGKTATATINVPAKPLTSIALNENSINLTVGDTSNATVTYNPDDTTEDKTVVWSSTRGDIASVVDGVITAKKLGVATITATVGNLTANMTVTVDKSPLKSISLNEQNTTLAVGKTKDLVVTYNPTDTTDNKTVTWSSDHDNIASVDTNGRITAHSPGTAIITANVGGKLATITVNVPEKPLVSISLSTDKLQLNKGENGNLAVTFNPTDTTADKTITWSTKDSNVATVVDGVVTATGKGTTEITATVGGKTAKALVEVSVLSNDVDIPEPDTEMTVGDVYTPTAKLLPEDTTETGTFTWSGDNDDVATVNADGTITAKTPGEVNVTVTANVNGREFTKTFKITVSPKPQFSYTVEHYKQNLVGDEYTLADSQTVTASQGDLVLLTEFKDYPGFTRNKNKGNTSLVVDQADLSMKVYYDRNMYTLTFLDDQLTSGSVPNPLTVRFGTEIRIPEPTMKKDGHTFDHWLGSKYYPNDLYTVIEDHAFTAVWVANKYLVSYQWTGNPDGAELPKDTTEYTWHQKPEVDKTFTKGAKVEGTKDGVKGTYTFSGWKEKTNFITDDGIEGDVIFTGIWTFEATKDEPGKDDGKDNDGNTGNENGGNTGGSNDGSKPGDNNDGKDNSGKDDGKDVANVNDENDANENSKNDGKDKDPNNRDNGIADNDKNDNKVKENKSDKNNVAGNTTNSTTSDKVVKANGTPNTGDANNLTISLIALILSTLTLASLRKKSIK